MLFLLGLVVANIVFGPGGLTSPTTSATAPPATPATTPTPFRNSNELTGDKVTNMGLVIRTLGYACARPEAAWHQGPSPYGMEFKVLCETGWFQVIVTPQDTFRVATWQTRLR